MKQLVVSDEVLRRSPGRVSRLDLRWFVVVMLCWIAGLAITWQRWGNPLVDCGREMNLPLRLAHGEMLYSQVRFLYGPFSPYLHAALYRAFGPSLGILYADGIFSATLILCLVYWLSRIWMGDGPAAAATLLVAGMCALKTQGNYILPYSYNALHGSVAGLLTLVLAIRYAQTRRPIWIFCAGLCAAVAMTAKTEFGAPAIMIGAVATLLIEYPNLRRITKGLIAFLAPALGIPAMVYAEMIHRVGWHVINYENHVFFANVPAELFYFNRWVSGTDNPVKNLALMFGWALQLPALAFLICWACLRIVRRREMRSAATPRVGLAPSAGQRGPWIALACGAAGWAMAAWYRTEGIGPFVAMPVLLLVVITISLRRYLVEFREGKAHDTENLALALTAIFSLAMLARIILRVRSGGSYASYLLPGTVVMLAFLWVEVFPSWFADPRARPMARRVALILLALGATTTMIVMIFRYRQQLNYRLTTPRGVIWMDTNYGPAFKQAMDLIEQRTAPGDPVAVMPEGTSLDFFTDRRNPTRDEIVTPGYLDAAGEENAIERIRDAGTRLVFITNRPTLEFGKRIFGQDYDQRLVGWIEANYKLCGVLGRDTHPSMEIGDRQFFIRAYCRD
jgi:hypothetical protein